MTDSKSTAIEALMDALEPASYNTPIDIDRVAYSQAISLKRIADALEILARPAPSATSMSHDTVALQILPGTWVNRAETAALQGQLSTWHEWPGGQCPVAAGTLVDVLFRDGEERLGVKAQERNYKGDRRSAAHAFWLNEDVPNDIVAWRLAK